MLGREEKNNAPEINTQELGTTHGKRTLTYKDTPLQVNSSVKQYVHDNTASEIGSVIQQYARAMVLLRRQRKGMECKHVWVLT